MRVVVGTEIIVDATKDLELILFYGRNPQHLARPPAMHEKSFY
jgi:hypothetical protein